MSHSPRAPTPGCRRVELLAWQAASPCNGTDEETGWQRTRYVLNFHMRASMWLLKKAPAAAMWLLHAALWLVVAWIFYGAALLLIFLPLGSFMDFLVIAHLCYTHGGWTSEASATYKEESVWGAYDRRKKV